MKVGVIELEERKAGGGRRKVGGREEIGRRGGSREDIGMSKGSWKGGSWRERGEGGE